MAYTLQQALKALLPIAKNVADVPLLHSIRVKIDEASATDRHVLAYSKWDATYIYTDFGERDYVLIPYEVAKLIAAKKSEVFTLTTDRIEFADSTVYLFVQPEGDYPNVDPLISADLPEEPVALYSLQPHLLEYFKPSNLARSAQERRDTYLNFRHVSNRRVEVRYGEHFYAVMGLNSRHDASHWVPNA